MTKRRLEREAEQSAREAERYAKATPIARNEHDGWLYVCDARGNDAAGREGFCADWEELEESVADHISDAVPEEDVERMIQDDIAKLHIYPCVAMSKRIDADDLVRSITDDYFEDAYDLVENIDELQALLDKWGEDNLPDSWEADFSRKIVIGEAKS